WIEQYKLQYQSTHPHILSSISYSLSLLNVRSTASQHEIESQANLVVSRCIKDLKFEIDLDAEYRYTSLAFCVIDSVFSIGVRYGGVKNVISNVSTQLGIPATIQDIDQSE